MHILKRGDYMLFNMPDMKPEEKNLISEKIGRNILRGIENAWLLFPEERHILTDCILHAGGSLTGYSDDQQNMMLWHEEQDADGKLCHIDYK